MKITIDVAKPEDAAEVADLLGQMGYPVSASDAARRMESYMQPSYRILVAKKEEVIVGFIALHFYHVLHLPAPEGRIISFCIDEKVRGTGVGTSLLKCAEDFFNQNGCYKIVLNSNLKRTSSHLFYLNRGYQFTSKHFAKVIKK